MKLSGSKLILACVLLALSCTAQTPTGPSTEAVAPPAGSARVAGQGPGNSRLTAIMQFGQANVGSPFPPDSGHDQSAHARDNVVPSTVVIDVGGTVTFNVPPDVHQIAIYEPGTVPGDIDTNIRTTLAAFAGCAGPPVVNAPLVINDPEDRVAAIPVPCFTPAQKSYTFTSPGKYLVICAFLPHFQVAMYGWVDVRE